MILLGISIFSSSIAQQNEVIYLSGSGFDQTEEWDFYCTDGHKSGTWTTIEVPSCWEQEGFGQYNYGHDSFDERLKEEGHYRYLFERWEQADVLRIVAHAPHGRLINQWTWPVKSPLRSASEFVESDVSIQVMVKVSETDKLLILESGSVSLKISKQDGCPASVHAGELKLPLSDSLGPQLRENHYLSKRVKDGALQIELTFDFNQQY